MEEKNTPPGKSGQQHDSEKKEQESNANNKNTKDKACDNSQAENTQTPPASPNDKDYDTAGIP